MRYAVAHDADLLHQIADYLAGPYPETDDDDLLVAAEDAEMQRAPEAQVLRLLADHYEELSHTPASP